MEIHRGVYGLLVIESNNNGSWNNKYQLPRSQENQDKEIPNIESSVSYKTVSVTSPKGSNYKTTIALDGVGMETCGLNH